MEIYQKIICRIVNVSAKYSNKMDRKRKENALLISCLMITCCALAYSCVLSGVHLLVKCMIGAILCVCIIFFSIDNEIKPVKWDKKVVYLWFAFGIIRLISGFVTSLEYLPLALIWLIIFPTIFLVWNNRGDYSTLVDCLYKAIVYPVSILVLISIFTVKVSSIGYGGITGNANSLGQYISVAFPLLLAKHETECKNKRKSVLWLVQFALFCVATFFTKSRTTVLMFVITFLAWIGYQLLVKKVSVKKYGIELVKIVLITLIIFGVTVEINEVVASQIDYNPVQIELKKSEKQEGGMKNIIGGYVDRMDGNDKHAGGLNNYSSGRIGIWESSLQKLNLLGHPSSDHIITERNGDVGNNVHNTFLQFAYDHGVLGGILFFLLYGMSLIKTVLICAKGKKDTEWILYVNLSYISVAMLASVNLPFLYVISFIYYISYAQLFEKENIK